MLIFIIFSLLLNLNSTFSEKFSVEITPGSYLSEINRVTVYEKSIPYKFILDYSFPNLQPIFSEDIDCNKNPDCLFTHKYYHSLLTLDSSIDTQLKHTHFTSKLLNNNTDRQKRNAIFSFYGDFLSFCCDVVTQKDIYPLYSNQKDLTDNYNILKEALIETHSNIFNISTELKIFSQLIHKNIKMLSNAVDYILQSVEMQNLRDRFIFPVLMSVLNKSFYNTLFSSIVQHCKEHKLPPSILPPEELKMYLDVLNENVEKFGFTLAIQTSNILEYYTQSITHCQISDTQMFIELRIPLKKLKSSWKLYKHIPIYFRHNDQLCILNTDQMLIAYDINHQTIREISGPALKKCDLNTHLCLIDYFNTGYESPECAKHLVLGKFSHDLNTVCNFRCEPLHSNTIIKKIQEHLYIISNPQKLLFLRNSTDQIMTPLEINYELAGAIKLKLPCDIELIQKTKTEINILIPPEFPCTKTFKQNIQILRILPLQWTDFDGTIEFNIHNPLKFQNLSKILNENWKEKTPHFDIKQSNEKFKEKLKNITLKNLSNPIVDNISLNDVVFITWLSILSFLVLVLLLRK